MIRSRLVILLSVLILLLSFSCSNTKYLKNNEYLLIRNKIHITSERKDINIDDLKGYITQTPNKKLSSLYRFKLWAYNKSTRGKDSKFNRWVINKIGEPPTIYDSLAARESANDIQSYVQNLGYFNAKVNFSTRFTNKKKKKLKVTYKVIPSKPYKIKNFKYQIEDAKLATYVFADTTFSLIKRGKNYDAFILDNERERIAAYLNNHGYYKFNKDYIVYEADSSLGSHKVDLTLLVQNVMVPDPDHPGKFLTKDHDRYFINNIYVNPEFNPITSPKTVYDTLVEEVHQIKIDRPANYYYILHKGKLKINPNTLVQSIFIENDEPFNLKDVQQTYKRFSSLGPFNYTSIQFSDNKKDSISIYKQHKLINCIINLSRAPLQSYTIEAEGTNSGGDLGVGGNFTYQNRNIFRGAEIFRLKLKGALEVQHRNSSSENDEPTILFFNTYEYGAEASVTFPKFLIPIKQERFPKYFKPKTNLTAGLNFQRRPKYSRYIASTTFGYEWNESEIKKHIYNPAEINLVKIYPQPGFQEDLDELDDQRLIDQYTDHLIMAGRYSFIFNNQDIRNLRNFMYFRGSFELSGNLLNLIDIAFNAPKDTSGHYTLFNIRYAQYVRTDFDYRYYYILDAQHSIVCRTIFGIGIPYSNSDVLPFEKGFYLGGANGMRGWRFRSLGPGAYNGPADDLDKAGDIQLEGNIEYRFPIYKFLKGALYVDIGNIWLLNPDKTFPDGEFTFDSFLSQLAFDTGFGFRFDFNFFVFRIDPAIKLKDPSRPEHDRWILNQLQLKDIIWNFGIGYPF